MAEQFGGGEGAAKSDSPDLIAQPQRQAREISPQQAQAIVFGIPPDLLPHANVLSQVGQLHVPYPSLTRSPVASAAAAAAAAPLRHFNIHGPGMHQIHRFSGMQPIWTLNNNFALQQQPQFGLFARQGPSPQQLQSAQSQQQPSSGEQRRCQQGRPNIGAEDQVRTMLQQLLEALSEPMSSEQQQRAIRLLQSNPQILAAFRRHRLQQQHQQLQQGGSAQQHPMNPIFQVGQQVLLASPPQHLRQNIQHQQDAMGQQDARFNYQRELQHIEEQQQQIHHMMMLQQQHQEQLMEQELQRLPTAQHQMSMRQQVWGNSNGAAAPMLNFLPYFQGSQMAGGFPIAGSSRMDPAPSTSNLFMGAPMLTPGGRVHHLGIPSQMASMGQLGNPAAVSQFGVQLDNPNFEYQLRQQRSALVPSPPPPYPGAMFFPTLMHAPPHAAAGQRHPQARDGPPYVPFELCSSPNSAGPAEGRRLLPCSDCQQLPYTEPELPYYF